MVLAAACSSQSGRSSHGASATDGERLFQDSPAVWFEEYYSTLQVTSDGRQALYTTPFNGRIRLIDLQGGSSESVSERIGVRDIRAAVIKPGGGLALLGTSGGRPGWYGESGSTAAALPLPADARRLAWSPDGREVAFARRSVRDSIFTGTPERLRAYAAGGTILGYTWLPSDSALLVLTLGSDGASTLSRLEVTGGRSQAVARDLDPPTFDSPVALAPDGRHAYIALATAGAPAPEVRHRRAPPDNLGSMRWTSTMGPVGRSSRPPRAPTPTRRSSRPARSTGSRPRPMSRSWCCPAPEAKVRP